MLVFPSAGGEPRLTMAGGWERAWILVSIFLEMEQEMIVCLAPSQESPCQHLPNPHHVVHPHTKHLLCK